MPAVLSIPAAASTTADNRRHRFTSRLCAGLSLATLAVVGATTAAAGHVHTHTHECIHDDPSVRRALYGVHDPNEQFSSPDESVVEMGRRQPVKAHEGASGPEELLTTLMTKQSYAGDVKDRAFRASAVAPMRFVFRTLDLDDPNQYCSSATATVPSFTGTGSTIACTAETVFNQTHKSVLKDVILPRAAEILSNILSVVPISGNLIVSSSSSLCGGQYTIPSTDRTTGVEDADIVFYVSAAPNAGASTIAWAGYCSIDSNGRPVVARTNFSPKYLNSGDDATLDYVTRVGVHEILHALGFSSSYFQSSSYFAAAETAATVTTSTRRGGQPVTLYSGPSALAAAREMFDCSSMDGIELEDEGGSGTAGSHWERRTHKEDVMAGIADVLTLSPLSFALLEDSGHYTVDKTKLETDYYMRHTGCGVFDQPCNTTAGGAGTYFCFTSAATCNFDYTGFGPCGIGSYSSNLPSWAQYFVGEPTKGGTSSLMDYCPVVSVYSNRKCDRWDNTAANSTSTGQYYASDGRCFGTSNTLYKNTVGPDNGPNRCFRSRCPDGLRIEFMIGDTNTWAQCPLDGSAGVVSATSPYTGTVNCPAASAFCTPSLYYATGATTTTKTTTTTVAPSTSTTTKKTTTTTAPSTSTTTKKTTTTTTTRPTTTTTKTTTTARPTTTTTKKTTTTSTTTRTTTTRPPTTTAVLHSHVGRFRTTLSVSALQAILDAFVSSHAATTIDPYAVLARESAGEAPAENYIVGDVEAVRRGMRVADDTTATVLSCTDGACLVAFSDSAILAVTVNAANNDELGSVSSATVVAGGVVGDGVTRPASFAPTRLSEVCALFLLFVAFILTY